MKHSRRVMAAALLLVSGTAMAENPEEMLGRPLPEVVNSTGTKTPRLLSDEDLDRLFDTPSVSGVDALVAARPIEIRLRGAREIGINRRVAPATVFLQQGESTCTGSLVSPKGEVLTCWHCVRGRGEVLVRLHPGTGVRHLLRGRVIRAQPSTDLALMQIVDPPAALPYLSLGREDEVAVGADVFAIGHPTGLNWSFVKGMVSQVYERRVWEFERKRHEAEVIQSQIALYPGNSGGPLVSEEGRIVGVNASKLAGDAFTFAIALAEVRRFLGQQSSSVVTTERDMDCRRQKVAEGRNAQDSAVVTLFDTDCDGIADASLSVPDDPKQPVVLAKLGAGGEIDRVAVAGKKGQTTYIRGARGSLKIDNSGAGGPQSGAQTDSNGSRR